MPQDQGPDLTVFCRIAALGESADVPCGLGDISFQLVDAAKPGGNSRNSASAMRCGIKI
jgi:hypothetical protein